MGHRIKIKAEGQLLSDPLIFLRQDFKRGWPRRTIVTYLNSFSQQGLAGKQSHGTKADITSENIEEKDTKLCGVEFGNSG